MLVRFRHFLGGAISPPDGSTQYRVRFHRFLGGAISPPDGSTQYRVRFHRFLGGAISPPDGSTQYRVRFHRFLGGAISPPDRSTRYRVRIQERTLSFASCQNWERSFVLPFSCVTCPYYPSHLCAPNCTLRGWLLRLLKASFSA